MITETANRFQKWADDYARAFGFTVSPIGNWVTLNRDGEKPIECYTAAGVQAACGEPETTDNGVEDGRNYDWTRG